MSGHDRQADSILAHRFPEAAPREFVTAFRSGTGGHRITVLADRIIVAYRHGGTSQLPLADVRCLSTFDTLSSQPACGVRVERRSAARDAGYLFEDDATRSAFLRAVGLCLGPGTA